MIGGGRWLGEAGKKRLAARLLKEHNLGLNNYLVTFYY